MSYGVRKCQIVSASRPMVLGRYEILSVRCQVRCQEGVMDEETREQDFTEKKGIWNGPAKEKSN